MIFGLPWWLLFPALVLAWCALYYALRWIFRG